VVAGVVRCQVLQWVEWKRVAAVVVDGLDRTAGEEPHALAYGHAGHEVANSSAQCVEEEALEWMVVERAESVWDVETVVSRVERSCM